MMAQNVNRRLQSPIRMRIVMNRPPNVRLSPVNQPLSLLKRNVEKPRMRPGQLAQITRRNSKIPRRSADIRLVFDQRPLSIRKIKPSATRRNQ